MFEVMPMYTDILGATLVLGTVIIITFENRITAMVCSKKGTKENMRKKSDAEFVEKGIKEEKKMKG